MLSASTTSAFAHHEREACASSNIPAHATNLSACAKDRTSASKATRVILFFRPEMCFFGRYERHWP